MSEPLAVDVRMIRHSGIGMYIRRTVLPALKLLAPRPMVLIGNPELLDGIELENATIAPYDVPIYSPLHHIRLKGLLAGRASWLWTPHFNAPATSALRHVVTIHDVAHVAHPEFFGSPAKTLVLRQWYASTVRRAKRIFCVSDWTRSELLRNFPRGEGKCEVIHNNLDPGWADFTPEPVPYARPYVLTVGNIKPHKNLNRMLEAFNAVKGRLDLDLVVVGQEGAIVSDARAAAALRTGGDRIHFPGYVDGNMLKNLYAKARFTVFPSLYEGFGFGPLESMALGTPAIVSDIPPAHEACGDAPLYFDPLSTEDLGSKMLQMSRDAVRDPLVEPGRRQAAKFSGSGSAERTAQALRNLLG